MISILVLASGRGSNFESILRAINTGTFRANILGLVCDRSEAPVLDLAKQAGVKTLLCVPHASESREQYDLRLIKEMNASFSDLRSVTLVLAGFKRILSKKFLEYFGLQNGISRVINIHPSLLPSFPGLESYKKAYEYGCKVTGVTVHYVCAEVDAGKIIAQESFSIAGCRSVQEVEALGLQVEHDMYPRTLEAVLNGPTRNS